MKRRLIIRPTALHDLEEHSVFLGLRNPDAWQRFIQTCFKEFDGLVEMPGKGRLREFRNPMAQGVRSVVMKGFSNYLIFYRVIADAVEILHVLHGARDIDSIFEDW